jgi:hypothetical protein
MVPVSFANGPNDQGHRFCHGPLASAAVIRSALRRRFGPRGRRS